jgi:outer membrane lipoprotein-sorting protein
VDVIELVPAVPDLPFERAIVWLDQGDALPRRLEITERSGALRTLTLSKVQVNQRVPDSTFAFDGAVRSPDRRSVRPIGLAGPETQSA